jgi:hypothetical protein
MRSPCRPYDYRALTGLGPCSGLSISTTAIICALDHAIQIERYAPIHAQTDKILRLSSSVASVLYFFL